MEVSYQTWFYLGICVVHFQNKTVTVKFTVLTNNIALMCSITKVAHLKQKIKQDVIPFEI